jgi:hypothetical protein
MTTNKQAFGTSTSLTITLNSLTSSSTAGRESTAGDNTTDLFFDVLVSLRLNVAAGTPANDQSIYLYAYGSEDGTNYTDNATGTDAPITLRDPFNVSSPLILRVPILVGGVTFKTHPIGLRQWFGGSLPRKWGIIVRNNCGLSLAASGNAATYTGIFSTNT